MISQWLRYAGTVLLADEEVVRESIVRVVGRAVRKQWRGWGMEVGCRGRFVEVSGSDAVEHHAETDHVSVPWQWIFRADL